MVKEPNVDINKEYEEFAKEHHYEERDAKVLSGERKFTPEEETIIEEMVDNIVEQEDGSLLYRLAFLDKETENRYHDLLTEAFRRKQMDNSKKR